VPTSFYGAGVVPTGAPPGQASQPPPPGVGQGQQGGGGQRNPFTSMPVPDTMGGGPMGVGAGMAGIGKPDVRRGNGMDAWPR
jgi:hypothetical protein